MSIAFAVIALLGYNRLSINCRHHKVMLFIEFMSLFYVGFYGCVSLHKLKSHRLKQTLSFTPRYDRLHDNQSRNIHQCLLDERQYLVMCLSRVQRGSHKIECTGSWLTQRRHGWDVLSSTKACLLTEPGMMAKIRRNFPSSGRLGGLWHFSRCGQLNVDVLAHSSKHLHKSINDWTQQTTMQSISISCAVHVLHASSIINFDKKSNGFVNVCHCGVRVYTR